MIDDASALSSPRRLFKTLSLGARQPDARDGCKSIAQYTYGVWLTAFGSRLGELLGEKKE